MKNVLTIIKKEFSRFFRDRRMLISIFLPGILIFLLYSVMGSVMSDIGSVDENYKPKGYIINSTQNIQITSALSSFLVIPEEELTEQQAKDRVANGTLDICISFPANFDEAIENGDKPDIAVYYNSSDENSSYAYDLVVGLLTQFENPDFTINLSTDKNYNLAEESKTVGQILAMVFPMLILALLASSCIAVAPEAIAGEKERGTMATMLITPVKRWQIALGKILSLSVFALLSGISSFIGVMLSLPKMMGGMVGAETATLYGFGDYLMLFGVIISVVLLIISAFSVLSCFAKSVKEAGSLITPLMMVIILLGVFSMFAGNSPAIGLFLVPLMGSAMSISTIMSFAANPLAVVLSIVSNLVVSGLLIAALAFMFNSERIMFKR